MDSELLALLARLGQQQGQNAANTSYFGDTSSYRGPASMAPVSPYPQASVFAQGQQAGQNAANASYLGDTASYRGPASMAPVPPYPLSDPLMGGQAGGFGPSRGDNAIETFLRQLFATVNNYNGGNR